MQTKDDMREAMELSEEMFQRMDDDEQHMEAIAVKIIQTTLEWVLDEEDAETLLEDLREDIEETDDW